jgi:hypothetical protein
MRISFSLSTILGLLFLCGCGDVPRSTVRGTIKYQGRPLRDAAVVFVASDNKTHLLDLQADGTYTVTGVARGPVKVAIQPEPEQAATSRAPNAPRKGGGDQAKDAARTAAPEPAVRSGPPIDPKYTQAETSGLTFELKDPEQEWSIDLK